MSTIIVAFSKPEDGKNIKNLLVRNGFSVNYVCTTGSQVLNCLDDFNDGIVICGYKLPDMMYHELYAEMPGEFEMLLLASRKNIDTCDDRTIITVAMPIKVQDLISTVASIDDKLMRRKRKRRQIPRTRNSKETEILLLAKQIIMEKKNYTEEEAHRYIQKSSMDSGNSMVDTAKMIITLMGEGRGGL